MSSFRPQRPLRLSHCRARWLCCGPHWFRSGAKASREVKVAAAAALDYDAMGSLDYRADRTLAGGIRLFPVGKYAQTPISVAIVENGAARPVRFSPDMFASKGKARALGISGIQVMSPNGKSNWLAYQGASYFRSAGSQDQYGLSARGLGFGLSKCWRIVTDHGGQVLARSSMLGGAEVAIRLPLSLAEICADTIC